MQVKTILNRIEKFKSFVYGQDYLVEEKGRCKLLVDIAPRANGRAVCSGCGTQRSGYDTLPQRRFEYVPLWGIAVWFLYAMRRVNCPQCGVVVKEVSTCAPPPYSTLKRCHEIGRAEGLHYPYVGTPPG